MSPLGEYLEGHGEAFPDFQTTEDDSKESLNKPSFAPSWPLLPAHFPMQKFLSTSLILPRRRSKTEKALQNICSAAIGVPTSASKHFLEQFRYPIVASSLLAHEAKIPVDTAASNLVEPQEALQYSMNKSVSLQGAAVTIWISFLTVWMLHWVETQSSTSTRYWFKFCVLSVLMLGLAIGIFRHARRSISLQIRHDPMQALLDLVTNCHALDQVMRSALSLIQEAEIVSRGYEISNSPPPISRIDPRGSDRRCLIVRRGLACVICSTIQRYLEAHSAIVPFIDRTDMQRYHDLYELAPQDYQDMMQGRPTDFEEDPKSLRGLKLALERVFIARQILLCDLLALPPESPIAECERWSVISSEIRDLSGFIDRTATFIENLITDEANRIRADQLRARFRDIAQPGEGLASDMNPPTTPGKQKTQAQLRRLNEISESIQNLYTRMLVVQNEAHDLASNTETSADITSVLANQYDLLGRELRSLMSEWEHGRNTMRLCVNAADRSSLSRSSSGFTTPHSPIGSLGGSTAITEGSPAEALKRLTSQGLQGQVSDGLGSDEEVFEAISLSPNSKRLSMTREEKLARMQEDRRKRATLQESRATTTNMLRELETVMKHRPRGRTTSRITSV
ncbi:hypothetical protein EPUS_02094 [Endocarpon pusillum Z07020]|uniref:Vezatin n=1 Tax=Endocarpon pusillum (strain Z07020 / HMAS-L-300199) TaxID=1263415 RepID=U1G4H8_ENDPU|nr:uncharacterized protein EPUS_02094 [Endocarpon pusillum Z07020]ERF72207.1 hypothetical protein EPUS_02094 [Endocarpon pusillum Z07020]